MDGLGAGFEFDGDLLQSVREGELVLAAGEVAHGKGAEGVVGAMTEVEDEAEFVGVVCLESALGDFLVEFQVEDVAFASGDAEEEDGFVFAIECAEEDPLDAASGQAGSEASDVVEAGRFAEVGLGGERFGDLDVVAVVGEGLFHSQGRCGGGDDLEFIECAFASPIDPARGGAGGIDGEGVEAFGFSAV